MKEIWKAVVGYEGTYEISSNGRVRSRIRRWNGSVFCAAKLRILKPKNVNGYAGVSLWRDHAPTQYCVHELVLEAFVGPCPDGMQCRHFPDPDKTNNHLENLQWGTRSENEQDKVLHGTSNRGERQGNSRLTKAQVKRIRKMRADGHTCTALGVMFGVSHAHISSITLGKCWKHTFTVDGRREG